MWDGTFWCQIPCFKKLSSCLTLQKSYLYQITWIQISYDKVKIVRKIWYKTVERKWDNYDYLKYEKVFGTEILHDWFYDKKIVPLNFDVIQSNDGKIPRNQKNREEKQIFKTEKYLLPNKPVISRQTCC